MKMFKRGIMFGRGYYSNQENIRWPGWYNGYRGFVPHYGVLEGIRDIPQQKMLNFPYLWEVKQKI